MTTQTEAMKLALEALENYPSIGITVSGADAWNKCQTAITALCEALAAQPAQQEPVAWMDVDENNTYSGLRYWSEPDNRHEVALYTAPQAQPAPEIAIADAYRAGVDSGIAAEREACAKVVEGFGESPANALTIRKGGVA